MWLSPNMTIVLLAVIWLATVYLALLVARTERGKRDNRWRHIVMMVVLVLAATLLALDQWVYDIL
ncbi:hypothetical protein [Phaeobacter sp. B1627]|uniref:hypothetical protein n=1 Tax=Phaeobacter sp. B1627 TaxID=2583809 RepID=UPI00111B4A21|nr:hypothetical protein [Phaeobacter sp. B1627]TNJ40629.1 hypothetical protein FGE21_17340 [Phaeobacter sp. B1627]